MPNNNSKEINEIMQEAVKISREAFGDILRQVWLYGSYARNEATEDSDIDFCVVVSEPVDSWKYIRDFYGDFSIDILNRYDELPEVFITDVKRFNESKIPVYETIKREGVLYYDL